MIYQQKSNLACAHSIRRKHEMLFKRAELAGQRLLVCYIYLIVHAALGIITNRSVIVIIHAYKIGLYLASRTTTISIDQISVIARQIYSVAIATYFTASIR